MTKVKIEPGICGFTTIVSAELNEDEECDITVTTGCPTINKMMAELGTTFDGIDVCLKKPGQSIFYEWAAEHYPVHAACPTINGILKCIEAESGLALKQDASICFIEE